MALMSHFAVSMLLVIHMLPILYFSNITSLFMTIGVSILLQLLTELPWLVSRKIRLWGSTTSLSITVVIVAAMTGLGMEIILKKDNFWSNYVFTALNIRLSWIWGSIAFFFTRGSSIEYFLKNLIAIDVSENATNEISYKLKEYEEKFEAMELKTRQLEYSVLKLKESQNVYIKQSKSKKKEQESNKPENIFVRSFPFNMHGSTSGMRRRQVSGSTSPNNDHYAYPSQNQQVSPKLSPTKIGHGLETILEQREYIDGQQRVGSTVPNKIIDTKSPLSSAFDKKYSNNLPSFVETSSPIFQPTPKTPSKSNLNSSFTEPPIREKKVSGFFSLHGFPFSSSITDLLTRQLVQNESRDQMIPTSGAESNIPPRAMSLPVNESSKRNEIETDSDSREELNLSRAIKHLLDDPSLSKLKVSAKCIRMLILMEISNYFQPYLTPEVLSTCNKILQYLLWQTYLNRSEVWRLLIRSSFFPLKLFKALAFDFPISVLKFQMEVTCYIPILLYRKLMPQGGIRKFSLIDKYSKSNSKPVSFHAK
ncbi:hypothetical protein CLIB1423_41S00298 [[Candida] railenensis]|uniref:Uncharacterized protein n=1 Tax=[Candida] railenensis TaxID=45579 RepID=A0A9P0QXA8_9ASCO|nr:hypothetical protein CLIB1423_41S00298 [[Candida] railenensis]